MVVAFEYFNEVRRPTRRRIVWKVSSQISRASPLARFRHLRMTALRSMRHKRFCITSTRCLPVMACNPATPSGVHGFLRKLADGGNDETLLFSVAQSAKGPLCAVRTGARLRD